MVKIIAKASSPLAELTGNKENQLDWLSGSFRLIQINCFPVSLHLSCVLAKGSDCKDKNASGINGQI